MQQQRISTNETPHIVIDARHHLKIEGWDEQKIELNNPEDSEVQLEPRADGAYIRTTDEATIRVPRNASIKIERAQRNLTVREVKGNLDIERVQGNFTANDVGSIQAGRVDGNFVATQTEHIRCSGVGGNGNLRDIIGNVEIGVGGNLDARHIEGEFNGHAGGNLDLNDVHSNVSANAGGNCAMKTSDNGPQIGSVRLNSGGQTLFRLGEGANATINVRDSRGRRRMVVGNGSANVQLSAGGGVNVEVRGAEAHWEKSEGQRGERRTIPLTESKHVHIESGESLRLTGTDGNEVIIERAGFGLEAHQNDGGVHIEAAGPISVLVPNGANVHAEAGMDATVRDFTGTLTVEAGISVKVRNYVGGLHAEAGSEANVMFTPTGDSHIEAGATIRCRFPEPGNVTVHIEDMRGERERVFGDGNIPIRLEAGASVSVGTSNEGDEGEGDGWNFQFNFDTGDLDIRMREFGDRISNMAREFSQRFEESGVPTWLADEMSGMQERIDDAMRRAQDKINRKVDSAVRRAEKRGARRGPVDFSGHPEWQGGTHAGHPEPPMPPDAPEPPNAPAAPAAPVPPRAPNTANAGPSSEERMMILRMLEQKKITADEAAKLLSALGDPA